MNSVLEVIINRCLGCHTCELECALAHSESSTLIEAVYSKERLYPRIILETDGDDVIPMHCRHCTEAPCITVCPTSAISRAGADEPVVLDQENCIGCNSCVMACPFGMIKAVSGTSLLSKCDLCIDRLKDGKIPACAEGCPTKAIRFTSINNLSEVRRKEVISKFRISLAQGEELEK